MGIVGGVLLIACANVASLLIARATARQREIAVRLAIGASRLRIVGQLLVESVMLAALGGALGLVVAAWTTRVLLGFMPATETPHVITGAISYQVLGFNVLLSLVTGLLFGLVPALRSTKPNLAPTLKDQVGTVAGGGSGVTVRKVLVVAQVTLSVLLHMRTIEHQIDRSLLNERIIATLSTAFGILATLLAIVGLCGVMAYTVARRTREIGVRMALGALPGNVVWLVMREVLTLVVSGVSLGLLGTFAVSQYVRTQLYGITSNDPATILAAAAALAAVAVLAGYLPALRATRINPVLALRYE